MRLHWMFASLFLSLSLSLPLHCILCNCECITKWLNIRCRQLRWRMANLSFRSIALWWHSTLISSLFRALHMIFLYFRRHFISFLSIYTLLYKLQSKLALCHLLTSIWSFLCLCRIFLFLCINICTLCIFFFGEMCGIYMIAFNQCTLYVRCYVVWYSWIGYAHFFLIKLFLYIGSNSENFSFSLHFFPFVFFSLLFSYTIFTFFLNIQWSIVDVRKTLTLCILLFFFGGCWYFVCS